MHAYFSVHNINQSYLTIQNRASPCWTLRVVLPPPLPMQEFTETIRYLICGIKSPVPEIGGLHLSIPRRCMKKSSHFLRGYEKSLLHYEIFRMPLILSRAKSVSLWCLTNVPRLFRTLLGPPVY